MVSSRVIRIDQEVWAELQRRAIPFKDNPNSVLRKILGLTSDEVGESNSSGIADLDLRVAGLIHLVEARVDTSLAVSPTTTGQSHRFKSQRGRITAFIHSQKRRLKIESSEQMAKLAGINSWDHWLRNGWWGQDNSVYWHIPNDDEGAYDRVVGILEILWRQ